MSASLSPGYSDSPSESFKYTALQFAVRRKSIEQVRYLIESGTELDTGPDPALHLAIRKKNTDIAILLLEAGANFEITDSHGDLPIHIACAFGLPEVVKVLCALGCSVEVPTVKGMYPLHLAAKYGHIAVVRCLCAAGCNTEVRKADNIRSDITALKYGHYDIAELLDRLRATGQRHAYARQLVPTSRPALRLSLRLLGHCGVGKSSLAKSLGAGLFSSLFRRSSSLQSNKSRPSSPINSYIEMDSKKDSRQNSLTFESPAHYHSTNGIHFQNLDISNVGDISVWEFSGQESYFPVYHHFLRPTPYSVTAILFNLDDSPSVQIQQVCFWINFVLARQDAELPTCQYGQIMLIATHVDLTRAVKNQHGEWVCPDAQETLETIRKLLPHVPNLMDTVVIMDSNVPASFAFKQLKSILANVKQNIIQQTIGTWTGLLENTLSWLSRIRSILKQFPVLDREVFSDCLRCQVNLLASDDHIDELLQQLQVMGEVFCVKYLVVLSVPWLTGTLLGELLSPNFISHARPIGVYSVDDFQLSYTQCDSRKVLGLLEALNLCVSCEIDGEVEYEFPIYNQIETIEGLWDCDDPRYISKNSVYGGLRFYTSSGILCMLKPIFSHVQINLRKTLFSLYKYNDSDLYQWNTGSKMCNLDLESMIFLEEDQNELQFIEIKVRGPPDSSHCCFLHFLEIIRKTVEDVREKYRYDIGLARHIQWGCILGIQELPGPIKLRLCGLLDPPESHGRDWCLLALRLGLCQKKIAALDSQHSSHTMRLLTTSQCTIGALITSLHELERQDAADIVLKSAPIFKVLVEHAIKKNKEECGQVNNV
ncbi:death-associated protein kinase 1-like [Sitophilus oryzae]|uniref:Death-associated protein kinase 1-like n=1 Tax=Sitophilus oryzae TaxID=7048 RepID=A0A6J2XIR3_SITOR|nr:death-associated protein kinase 1-like [Sitophilus oryzae]